MALSKFVNVCPANGSRNDGFMFLKFHRQQGLDIELRGALVGSLSARISRRDVLQASLITRFFVRTVPDHAQIDFHPDCAPVEKNKLSFKVSYVARSLERRLQFPS